MIPDREDALQSSYESFDFLFGRFFGGDLDLLILQLKALYSAYAVVATIVSLILFVGIIYSYTRLYQIRREEEEELRNPTFSGAPSINDFVGGEPSEERPGAAKWAIIMRHIESENPNDWRLAVLEADILLDTLVRERGWIGETLGERLKNVDKSDFNTIDKAWEAHRVRNAIAHEGGNFLLSEREAKRTVSLFREVFEEFNYI